MNKKVISLVCESFNLYDAKDTRLQDLFSCKLTQESMFYKMNISPSRVSAQSLYALQSKEPVNPHDAHNTKVPKVFAEKNKFIANYAKTRIISYFWPTKFDISYLDPRADNMHREIKLEPLAYQFPILLSFLKEEFYNSDYMHVIYWSNAGHGNVGCRIGEEDKGVAASLTKTLEHWFKVIENDILPLVDRDKTILMIHPDHGTARKGMGHETFQDGFFYLYPKESATLAKDSTIEWADIRKTIRNATGIDDKMPYKEEGRIIGK